MTPLSSHPRIVRLARELGLSTHGDCVRHIREHALGLIAVMRQELPVPNLGQLRQLVAAKMRAKLEFVRDDADVARIADAYPDFHPALRQQLHKEFLAADTEGITLERDDPCEWAFQFLVVVDARGLRWVRAYFTAWHELTHLLLHPPQLDFPGFRRTPALEERAKDPLESIVDYVAGHLAFYEPFFAPPLKEAISRHGGLCFAALEATRERVAPDASLFATAIGGLRWATQPTLLVSVGWNYKASEARALRSLQEDLGLEPVTPKAKLRVTTVVPNESVKDSDLAIRRNMRVPERSVLARVHASEVDVTAGADEDQSWWSTSATGALPALPLRVEAIRRGRFVYGLIRTRRA